MAVLAAAVLAASCESVSETGRSRIALIPESVMNSLGADAYVETTSGHREITGTKDAEMVQRLGKRIAAASGKDYQWEFKLLDAPDVVNAFCLPGGKVAVYSGLLKVTQNEAALAAVVGHEVAHATAQHGNERMSQNLIAELGLFAAGAALGFSDLSEQSRAEIMGALGTGTQFGVLLPFSRKHESEADEIGLRYLIRAGYDPHEAPKLWDRMAAMAGPDRQPEFMSTHPDPAARAARLRELIPTIVAEEKARAGTR
jgi:predicted Zn-dependent protease